MNFTTPDTSWCLGPDHSPVPLDLGRFLSSQHQPYQALASHWLPCGVVETRDNTDLCKLSMARAQPRVQPGQTYLNSCRDEEEGGDQLQIGPCRTVRPSPARKPRPWPDAGVEGSVTLERDILAWWEFKSKLMPKRSDQLLLPHSVALYLPDRSFTPR